MRFPSDAHLKAFGSLVYQYANAEVGLKFCLSGMLNLPPHIVMIFTEPYSAVNLRTVIKALAKEYNFKGVDADQLAMIIGELKTFGPLRNSISHSRWTDGTRPGAIKPRAVDIRSEKAVWRGSDPDEKDWTAEEIEECAMKIVALNRRILQFMTDGGLTERIERHIASASDDTEE